jgi:hypothetical protein
MNTLTNSLVEYEQRILFDVGYNFVKDLTNSIGKVEENSLYDGDVILIRYFFHKKHISTSRFLCISYSKNVVRTDYKSIINFNKIHKIKIVLSYLKRDVLYDLNRTYDVLLYSVGNTLDKFINSIDPWEKI